MAASLIFTDSNGEPRAQRLTRGVLRIGRIEANDLAFDNPYISRFHAEIKFDGLCCSIRDLDSTSGTFVNNERIKQRVLSDGDNIRLGRGRGIEIIFRADETGNDFDQSEEEAMRPLRVIAPEDARFINTSMLPRTADLANGTVERLRALYEFSNELLTAQSSKDLSEKLAAFLHRTLGAERSAVLLCDRKRNSLEVIAACPAQISNPPSKSVTSRVYKENVAVLSLDARADARFASGDSVKLQAIRSVMCAPIGSKTRRWGVCYVDNMTSARVFDDEELEYMTALARQAGLAIENLHLLEEQRRSLESFICTLAASLDARDDSTAGHSARVGAYAAGIARAMGLLQAEARLVYYAGLLHDYGKIGIRDDVLLKPAELTPEEYEHVKQHPLHTFRLLSKIRLPEDLADIPFVAASHHERWDGSGYPYGLKGDEIPLGSRIVAIADFYDALTEERVYHEPWSPEKTVVEIAARAGASFDPAVVEVFLGYFKSEVEPRSRRAETRKPSE